MSNHYEAFHTYNTLTGEVDECVNPDPCGNAHDNALWFAIYDSRTGKLDTTACVPVKVEKGRKFKGRGFLKDIFVNSFGGETAQIIVLGEPRPKYASLKFVDFDEASENEIAQFKARQANFEQDTVNNTIAWCRKVSGNKSELEILKFARNCLRKNHPEIDVEKYIKLDDVIDVAKVISDTIQWALTLKSRPGRYYGKYVEGGKPLTKKRYARIIWKSLVRKGVTNCDGFEEALQLNLTLFNLPDPH